jgi:aminoglycoside 2'-N-acetyltransferase I
MTDGPLRIRRLATADLTADEIAAIRAMLVAAFDDPDEPEEAFTEDDWQHALDGVHVVADVHGAIVAHASVVERELRAGGRPLRTGYVEAVASEPALQGRGHGTAVMTEIGTIIREGFELGALGTGAHHFYERLGWDVWPGPTAVRTDSGERRTPVEDGDILILRTPTTPALDEHSTLSCPWRPGDVW